MNINIFIQARMSSARFPGKMLADLNGTPLIKHVVKRALKVPNIQNVVVLTSTKSSDEPLEQYLQQEGYHVFKGDLHNVFLRFQQALKNYPCDYFIRVCGDSPIIDPGLIDTMVELIEEKKCDFLSNVYHKKYPKGQSVEIIRSSIFADMDSTILTSNQCEHVTPHFYENVDKYQTYFPDCTINQRHINTCVDTLEDLKNIESGAVNYSFQKESLC